MKLYNNTARENRRINAKLEEAPVRADIRCGFTEHLAHDAEHHIERDIVAAHDDEIGRTCRVGDQRDLDVGVRIERAG